MPVKLGMPPEEKTILEPQGGWQEDTYYVVLVAHNKNNPIHRSILYLGFLNGSKGPLSGGYTCLMSREGVFLTSPLHYVEVISVIEDMKEN